MKVAFNVIKFVPQVNIKLCYLNIRLVLVIERKTHCLSFFVLLIEIRSKVLFISTIFLGSSVCR